MKYLPIVLVVLFFVVCAVTLAEDTPPKVEPPKVEAKADVVPNQIEVFVDPATKACTVVLKFDISNLPDCLAPKDARAKAVCTVAMLYKALSGISSVIDAEVAKLKESENVKETPASPQDTKGKD